MEKHYYVVKEKSGQFRENEIHDGCTIEQNSQKTIKINRFTDLEPALEKLNKYQRIVKFYPSCGGTLYLVTEYFVEENYYDENGNIVSSKIVAYAKA